MSGAIATTYVKVRPDASGFKAEAEAQLSPELQAIQARITAMRGQADALSARVDANRAARDANGAGGVAAQSAALGTLAARASVVAGIVIGIKDTIDAASNRESSLALVEQSVENAGAAWGLYSKQVTDALDAQRRATGFAYADIAQSFARLEEAFKDPKKALEELGVAEDVARAQGKDLAQVATSISEAAQGQFSNLNALGTVTKELTTRQDELKRAHAELIDSGGSLSAVEQQQYQDRLKAAQAADRQATSEAALAELAQRNAGQAQAYISSTRGGISQLKTSLTELEEQIGGPLLTVTGDLALALSGAIQGYIRYSNLVGSGLRTITGLFDSATSSATDFAQAVQASQTAGTRGSGLTQVVSLLREASTQAQAAGHLGKNGLDVFQEALQKLASQNPAIARQLTDLQGIARAAGGLQNLSDIEIKVVLTAPDTTAFTNAVVAQIDKVSAYAAQKLSASFDPAAAAGLKPLDFFKDNNLTEQAPDRGGHAAAVKDTAKKDAVTYSTAFVQTIDLSGIATALDSAIDTARQNASAQASALASSVGDVLDARLKKSEDRLDAQAAAIQDRIQQREAAATARSTSLGADDAALKLKQLQDVLGTGPLTADQTQALKAAQNAVLDAKDAIANAEDQTQSDAVAAKKTALEQEAALQKTASDRRIADLTDELNRGLITQAQYVKGVRQLLDKEGVSYKQAGALLGTAFADGFADSLKAVVEQAKALGLVGTTTLKGKPTSTKATNPLAEQAKAAQSVVDQIAGSGGRFNLTGAGTLPPGVTVSGLLAAAGSARADAAYRTKSTDQADRTIHYTGLTADHTLAILKELQKANAKPPVVVVDDKKAKAKHAQATR